MRVKQVKVREAAEVPIGGVFRCVSTSSETPPYMRMDVTKVRRGELPIAGHVRAICLETAVVVVLDGDVAVVFYPLAELRLGAHEIEGEEHA